VVKQRVSPKFKVIFYVEVGENPAVSEAHGEGKT